MTRAVYTQMGSLSSYRYGVDSYDSTKLGLGTVMVQQNNTGNEGKWAGPHPISVIRPVEFSTAVPSTLNYAFQWSSSATSSIDWVFFADAAAAAATRRIAYATYNRLTQTYALQGFIIITFPFAGSNVTIRSLRMTYDKHTAGTVAVSGTAVTGTSTTWQTDRACVGNRIGFGSTDPTAITTWYEISAIASDTGITLTSTAGTITSGTAYVIEDLRAVLSTTTNVANTAGLVVIKGLRPEIFNSTGTGAGAVPAATTVDNIKASYWLADASTALETVGVGLALEPSTSKQSQMGWILDNATAASIILYKYNIRAALTLTSGKDTTAIQFKTGASPSLTGTVGLTGNGTYAVLNHGPGKGLGCIYFTTTTRVYRTIATTSANMFATSVNFVADVMNEVPPGSVNTFAVSSLLATVEYMTGIDKLIIALAISTTPFRSYITSYQTNGTQFDRVYGSDIRQIDQVAADPTTTPVLSYTSNAFNVFEVAGLVYFAGIGTTALTNRCYVVPLGADWEYAYSTGARLIFPSLTLASADSLVSAFAQEIQVLGGSTLKNLGQSVDPWRMYYRLTGITDDSGAWTLLDQTNSLGNVSNPTTIQLMIEFRTISPLCLPSRINMVGVIYNDTSTLANYQFSSVNTSASAKRFAWRFVTAFGTTVPALRVRIYDANTGGLLVDDNTASASGTFEQSTDGGTTWVAWTTTDKGSSTITYLRYTPASLADNVKARASLTLH